MKSAKIEAKVTTFSHEVKSCALMCVRVCACVGVFFVGEEFVLICLLDERETALGCRTRERAHSFREAGTTHAKQSVTRQTLTDGKTAKRKNDAQTAFESFCFYTAFPPQNTPLPQHLHADTCRHALEYLHTYTWTHFDETVYTR